MQHVEIKGYIYARAKESWEDGDGFVYSFFDFDIGGQWFKVCPHKIVEELPEDFNPVAARIAALQDQMAAVRADFAKRIRGLQEEISKLEALPFNGESDGQ